MAATDPLYLDPPTQADLDAALNSWEAGCASTWMSIPPGIVSCELDRRPRRSSTQPFVTHLMPTIDLAHYTRLMSFSPRLTRETNARRFYGKSS